MKAELLRRSVTRLIGWRRWRPVKNWTLDSAVRELHVLLLQKGDQFIHAEVGEDLPVPVEHRRLALAREVEHLAKRGGILADVLLAVADAVFRQEFPDLDAPWASGFDLENRASGFHGGLDRG